MKNEQFQPHLEWELPCQELITHISFENKHYDLPTDCMIKIIRDNQHDLKATISGIINNREALDYKKGEGAGTVAEHENIYGYSIDGIYKYKISGIVVGKTNFKPHSLAEKTLRFESDLLLDNFEKSMIHESEILKVQDWFLSGTSPISFSRHTYRGVTKEFIRARIQIDPKETSSVGREYGDSKDCLFANLPDFNFIVAKVPNGSGPEWSFNLCIEYRSEFKQIPDDDTRTAISEFVSFVLGGQLLHIGSTSYGEADGTLLQKYKNPWGDNVISKCSRSGLPPTRITSYNMNEAELLINTLLPEYLNLRKKYRLKDVIWKFWIGIYSSIGTNLPILSSAIESLAEMYLKEHTEIKHYYIEYNEFQNIIKKELELLEKTLDKYSFKDKIVRKIKGASQRGSNEKLEMFFEDINLKIGTVEKKALKERNKMAHSSLGELERNELIELIKITRAYETLFNRVLLKILGYEGNYIDYFTPGHPERNINEPIP